MATCTDITIVSCAIKVSLLEAHDMRFTCPTIAAKELAVVLETPSPLSSASIAVSTTKDKVSATDELCISSGTTDS